VREKVRNNPEDKQVREEGGWGAVGASGSRANFPLQPMKEHGRSDTHTVACGGPHTAADEYALKKAAARGKDPRWPRAEV